MAGAFDDGRGADTSLALLVDLDHRNGIPVAPRAKTRLALLPTHLRDD
jgi:hypothetical protein